MSSIPGAIPRLGVERVHHCARGDSAGDWKGLDWNGREGSKVKTLSKTSHHSSGYVTREAANG